jgi:DedD protein
MANKDDLLNMNEKKGIKKPLIYGAIAFLVFIIGVLGYAIYSNSSKNQDNVVIPPQIEQNNKQQETMFKEVPIEETNSQTNKQENTENNENLTQKLLKNEENTSKPQTKPQISTKEQIPQEETKTEPVKKQPKTVQKTEKKPAKKTVSTSKEKYYVQVAALMKYKKPNKKFLQLIKKEGYSYRLYNTYYVKNGKKIEVVKILIGPFDKKEVRKELKKIKNTITQNAFIFKVK